MVSVTLAAGTHPKSLRSTSEWSGNEIGVVASVSAMGHGHRPRLGFSLIRDGLHAPAMSSVGASHVFPVVEGPDGFDLVSRAADLREHSKVGQIGDPLGMQ